MADALALLWQAPVKLGPPNSSKFYEPFVWSLVEAATTLQQSPYKRLKGRGRAHMAHLTLKLWPLNRPLAEKVLAANPDPAHATRTRARAEADRATAFWPLRLVNKSPPRGHKSVAVGKRVFEKSAAAPVEILPVSCTPEGVQVAPRPSPPRPGKNSPIPPPAGQTARPSRAGPRRREARRGRPAPLG